MDNLESNAPAMISEEEFVIGMPDGFGPDDDIFADPSTWTGSTDASNGGVEAQKEQNAEGQAPTTEQNSEAGNEQEGNGGQPTKQSETGNSRKIKVPYTFDHVSGEEEIDLDKDLTNLVQKAKATDRAQERLKQSSASLSRLEKLAKTLEYDDANDFFNGTVENLVTQRKNALMSEGVHSAVAEKMARDEYAELLSDVVVAPAEPPASSRDFQAETDELMNKHPELKDGTKPVPNEVVMSAIETGNSILVAYEQYMEKQEKAELQNLRKENKTLKHNADAASRAPVRGTTEGGATDMNPEDPFIKGLTSSNLW